MAVFRGGGEASQGWESNGSPPLNKTLLTLWIHSILQLVGETAATTTLVIFSMGPSGPVSLWFFRKVGSFSDRLWGELGQSLGMTREDRGKGTRLSLIMTGYPQIILPKLLQSLSGLLSSLAAALVRKYVRPSFCARTQCSTRFWTSSDLYQKLIAFQKHDEHTYNTSCQSLAHYPLSVIQCLTLMCSAINFIMNNSPGQGIRLH